MNNKKTRQYFGSEIGQGGVSAFMTSSYPKSFIHNIYIKSVLQEPEDNCRSGVAGHLAKVFEDEGNWEGK